VPRDVTAAVEAIKKYLRVSPEAKDTVDGAKFWCVRYGVMASRAVVQEALNVLVEEGVVRQRAYSQSGRVMYSRGPGVESLDHDIRIRESQKSRDELTIQSKSLEHSLGSLKNQSMVRSGQTT